MPKKGHTRFFRSLILTVAAAMLAPASFAQLTSTGIHGIVKDPSGAMIPGATLTLKDTSTGIEKRTTSAKDGGFVFPDVVAGTYAITAAAKGFDSQIMDNIVVDAGRTTDVTISLKIGAATETVEVTATGAQLETSSNEIGLTVNNNNIQNLPYSSRDTLSFAGLSAGYAGSDFNNLPQAAMNISIDGMDNNTERFRSGSGSGFSTVAPERIDAVEEVTVSTTGTGADSAGFGAMNVRFQTKRGTDHYHFTVGEQFANTDLNANSFFNNLRGQPIAITRQNNAYGSIGGPLLPFIPSMKHKLFFFAYFEAQPQPSTSTLTATVLSPAAQQGNFTYLGTDGQQHTVNVLAIAQAAGYPSTIDPTIQSMLGVINASESKASGFLGITNEFYASTMEWTQPADTLQMFPAARVDYQIAPNVAWHGSWSLHYENIHPSDPNYPGLNQFAYDNAYRTTTYVATNAVDWTITPHMVNTANFGIQGDNEYYYPGSTPFNWQSYGNRILETPTGGSGAALIYPTIPEYNQQNVLPYIRNAPVYQFRDDLNWVKGKHTLTFGGVVKHNSFYETFFGTGGVPNYAISLPSGDPLTTIIQNALPFVNTSVGDQTTASSLYALLTGTVSGVSGNVNVDEHTHQYQQYQPVTQRFAGTFGGLYIHDVWRLTPHLTINAGFHWEFDGAIHETNGIDSEPTGSNFFGPSTGLFSPGVMSGNTVPNEEQVSYPYKRDFLLPAPVLGLAWSPTVDGGPLHKLLGNNKTVIRVGGGINDYNEGTNTISNTLNEEQENTLGDTQSISATAGLNGFPTTGILLSGPAPALATNPTVFGYPVSEALGVFTGGFATGLIDPKIRSPYVANWNLSIQRELPGRVVLEVDYVGNKSTRMWHYQNLDEVNIFENGFLSQFVQAQSNLAINQANGKGNTFANNGLAGQVNLPIFQQAFGANGSQAALAASSGYSNSTFITDLEQGVAGTMASTMASTTTIGSGYYCRLVGSNFAPCASAGFTQPTSYPVNFFVPNPYVSSLGYLTDNGNNHYDALQVVARKAMSHGLAVNGNFTWSHALGDLATTDQTASYQWWTQRNGNLNYGPSSYDRRFVFNAFWTYDLPIGKGKALNLTNAILDRVAGGWTLGGIETISTGAPSLLSSSRDTFNNREAGGVEFGGGLTSQQLRNDLATIPNMHAVTSSGDLITNVASIAASNGAPNPAYYGPYTTPGLLGDLGTYIYAPTSFTLNMSLNKQVRIKEHLNVGFRMEALNFLNHPFFTSLGTLTTTGTTFGQIGSTSGTRSVLLRAYLSW
jgi:hypothetical protein